SSADGLPDNLWGTCSLWGRELCCPHTLCVKHELEGTSSPALEAGGCRFKMSKQRRNMDRLFEESTLPSNARHGLNPSQRHKKRAAAVPAETSQEPSAGDESSECATSARAEGTSVSPPLRHERFTEEDPQWHTASSQTSNEQDQGGCNS
ncbi:hypothetical protein FOL47_000295, partial [Perkinsus chesapeaki]